MVALFGAICLGAGVLVLVFVWRDGLAGMYSLNPYLTFVDAAKSSGLMPTYIPDHTSAIDALLGGQSGGTIDERIAALPASTVESIMSVWTVLWLVTMNHLAVAFFLYGFRALVFVLECPGLRPAHPTHSPLAQHPTDSFQSGQYKLKVRYGRAFWFC